MELRNIFTFLRAVELGSFTKTADALGYAQSTVTMQIQQLEEELGKPLFDRFNRSISLTAFGESFLPLAQRMYNTAQEMNCLATDSRELGGTLRIGIVESLFFSNFLKLIPQYQAMFPNVNLNFFTYSSVEIIDLLMKNQLDLGCYLEESGTAIGLVQHFSRSAPVVFVANRDHPLTRQSSISLDRIAQERFILTEEISIYHQTLLKLFQRNHLSIRKNILLKSTRGIVEVLKYSDGIAFLPEYAVREEIKQGTLQIITANIPPVTTTAAVTTHRSKWLSPQIQSMINLLRTEPWL